MEETYLPLRDSITSQGVLRTRQCQHGCDSVTSHLTRRVWQALQATRARRDGLLLSNIRLLPVEDMSYLNQVWSQEKVLMVS